MAITLDRIQLRSAVLCAEMEKAAFARNLRWMLSTTLKLRNFVTDFSDPFFRCRSEELLLDIDGHVARLRHIIGKRRLVR
jgi:hypothetical protein